MGFLEILLIGIGVAGDAFAVSICKGVTSTKKLKTALICAIWFAGFQMLMPAIGFLLGSAFYTYIEFIDHWIVVGLLTIIGANMIKESFSSDEEGCGCCDTSFKTMLMLAIATSIDALAIGVTFALTKVNMLVALLTIGSVTFAACVVGGMIGQKIGEKNQKFATLASGIVLIVLGVKILIEHLFF